MPKPPIELNKVDTSYTATRLHFADLFRRYSSPILVTDLVKQSEKREREVRVGNEYRAAVDFINSSIDDKNKIQYCALDYSHISKHPNVDVSVALGDVSSWAVNQTGFFCSDPKWKIDKEGVTRPFTEEDTMRLQALTEETGVPFFPMEQHGVLRTNCIE
jgi:phosphatidylinositol 3,5-bisphosphate 5-phosphatase